MMLCLIRAVDCRAREKSSFRDGEKLVKNTILRFRAEIKRKTGFFRKKALSGDLSGKPCGQMFACPGGGGRLREISPCAPVGVRMRE